LFLAVSAHKVEITLGFATALTTDEQLKVRMGIASAANTPVGNVEVKLKTRRAVEYIATVYAADATAASAVETKLSDAVAVTAAISAAGAPSPTMVGLPVRTAGTAEDSVLPLAAVIGIVVGVVVLLIVVAAALWRLHKCRSAGEGGHAHAHGVVGVSTADVEVEVGRAHAHNVDLPAIPSISMGYCCKCGEEWGEVVTTFCMVCAASSSVPQDEMIFFCPHCGKDVPPKATPQQQRFCGFCSGSLRQGPAALRAEGGGAVAATGGRGARAGVTDVAGRGRREEGGTEASPVGFT
jgi:hypothetical protein